MSGRSRQHERVTFSSTTALTTAFRTGELSPAEYLRTLAERTDRLEPQLRAYACRTGEIATEQARAATEAYRRGETGELLGVPLSVKDCFHLAGAPTGLGSLLHKDARALTDSGVVRRLREAGAVITGKTNMAEFGQSATSENLLGPEAANPWDTERTPGGSSGGSAVSVAAGLATASIGSDGGGSVRIPSAFCGLVGVKPSQGLCVDEDGFRAMTPFSGPGPITASVADARLLLGVLASRVYPRSATGRKRIAVFPAPQGRPVHEGVAKAVHGAVTLLEQQGHEFLESPLPIEGWAEIFGPLVLAEEHRERGHLLGTFDDRLTRYELATLRGAARLEPAAVAEAERALRAYRSRFAELFGEVDLLVTPSVAVPAFPHGQRPRSIGGVEVDPLWGAYPFSVPFNVAGAAAVSLPCGLAEGLPVGVQLVAAPGNETVLLDVAEELEEAIAFDRSALRALWP